MLDIHQLNVFLVAAQTLSFTQAAHQLHMTQPSVSQHIQFLEKHFNVDLFTRNGRNLELTDAGAVLLPLAKRAVNLSVQMDEQMEALQAYVYGHLIVGCSTTPGKYLLPQILAKFHNIYPLVTITCNVSQQIDALKSLSNGTSHFALFSLEYDNYPDIEGIPFLDDPIVLIAPLNHPWARSGRISPEDLLSGDYIMREAVSGTYDAVSATLAEKNIVISNLNIFITLGNAEAIALSVMEGIGVGFVSKMVVEHLCKDKVKEIQIDGVEINRKIFIGRNVKRQNTNAQNKFWQFVVEETSNGRLIRP